MDIALALILFIAESAPRCAEEDGSTQSVCVWDDGTGDAVLNLDHGTYWITLGGE
ncbi:hypothetical protein ACFPM3_20145 [Streptomyces coeruleoprunus]|uniref:Uncharacterized protein n=1 Tax=Streptomyces coeruleoprunus TaxID=285563 RepID=A0ABV9XIY2_9ACTN